VQSSQLLNRTNEGRDDEKETEKRYQTSVDVFFQLYHFSFPIKETIY